MPLIRRFALPLLLAALFAAPWLAGCAGPPHQQVFDARQAIRAAERAGAQKHAPQLLAEAKALVESARQATNKEDYRQARDAAEQARAKAMEARRIAEEAVAAPLP